MLLGGAVNGERAGERGAEWVGEHMGDMEDGRWSSISIKGTEFVSSIL